MRTTEPDPIIAEVRAVRAEYAARFDCDVEGCSGILGQDRMPPAAGMFAIPPVVSQST